MCPNELYKVHVFTFPSQDCSCKKSLDVGEKQNWLQKGWRVRKYWAIFGRTEENSTERDISLLISEDYLCPTVVLVVLCSLQIRKCLLTEAKSLVEKISLPGWIMVFVWKVIIVNEKVQVAVKVWTKTTVVVIKLFGLLCLLVRLINAWRTLKKESSPQTSV